MRISKQAFEKFEASVALQPQDAKSLVMWADSCLNIALADAELESAFGLLEKAYELSYRADELCEGIGSYTIGTSPITISVVCTHSLTHSPTHPPDLQLACVHFSGASTTARHGSFAASSSTNCPR